MQRQAECPLCRAPFPPGLPLAVNCELRELLRLAEALTAVEAEGEEGWQAVTTGARLQGDKRGCGGGGGSGEAGMDGGGHQYLPPPPPPPLPSGCRPRVEVGDVLDGSGSVMELDPQPWEPDSSSLTCRHAC